MRVRLLGSFDVEGVPERRLGSRKGRTLLKVLALARGVPVSVDRIADLLWGDDQPARPADQVGVLVSRLRGVLGAERIGRSDAGYSLVVDWLDVEELFDLAAVSAEALATGRLGAARAAAGAALALVRGQLLPDLDGAWIESERAGVHAVITSVQRLAVDAAAAAGDHGAAAGLAEQALVSDPYDEAVLRALMAAHLGVGRPASALAAYATVRERLAEDLGVPPTAETEAVYLRALADGRRRQVAGPVRTEGDPGPGGPGPGAGDARRCADGGGRRRRGFRRGGGARRDRQDHAGERLVPSGGGQRRGAAGAMRRARAGPSAAAGDRRPGRPPPDDALRAGGRPRRRRRSDAWSGAGPDHQDSRDGGDRQRCSPSQAVRRPGGGARPRRRWQAGRAPHRGPSPSWLGHTRLARLCALALPAHPSRGDHPAGRRQGP